MNSKISLTPHIGAATGGQDRIGTELASQIISLLVIISSKYKGLLIYLIIPFFCKLYQTKKI
jgi:hypothetical protein